MINVSVSSSGTQRSKVFRRCFLPTWRAIPSIIFGTGVARSFPGRKFQISVLSGPSA